jgi:hypothetical protein
MRWAVLGEGSDGRGRRKRACVRSCACVYVPMKMEASGASLRNSRKQAWESQRETSVHFALTHAQNATALDTHLLPSRAHVRAVGSAQTGDRAAR